MIPRTLRSHSERAAEFYVHVQNVVWRRMHSDLSGSTANVGALKAIIEEERRKFLEDNLDFRPDGEVNVTAEGDRMLITCEVIPWIDLQAREAREAQKARMWEEICAARKRDEKRMRSMIRRLRRLTDKHNAPESFQPGLRSVWHMLTDAQQYAILKDIDYAARHIQERK